MPEHRRIFLVGPMGAGKSTIGRRLARSLGLTFLDSDREIEQRTGVDIPLIFEIEGEEGFRRRERQAIDSLSQRDDVVLATGGGVVLSEENRRALRERGTVIYLETSLREQLRRTRHDRRRPLLQTENPEQRLEALLSERDPLYREVAHLIISTDGAGISDMVQAIIRELDKAT